MFKYWLILCVILATAVIRYYHANRGLPPGPKRLPFIGNIHQLPTEYPWRVYHQWSKKYGPIFSLRVGLDTIIMLNNHETASDLLDKRSSIYSSRPRLVMGGECLSKGLRTLLMPYDQRWKIHARLQASYLNVRISQSYTELQDIESTQMVYELLKGHEFPKTFHRFSSSLMYTLAYGKRLETLDTKEGREVELIVRRFLQAAQVGTWIVDALPMLNYLPKWLAPWKVKADEWHEFEASVFSKNFNEGEAANGWNWTKQVLSMKESQAFSRLELAYDVGIIYEAGSDTTTMSMEIFILACLLYPDFVVTAQTQLDEMVGNNRLPDLSDVAKLPYITAIFKEVLRWRPVTAGGIPHAVIEDDQYMGYRIPKGATVIGNHWAIHMDETIFKDPLNFDPDRYIENPNLPMVTFGFGRRACGGQHIVRNSLSLNFARMLWAFNIRHAVIDGVKQEVDSMAMTQGFNSRPQPFKAEISVRDPVRQETIERSWRNAEKDATTILDRIRPQIRPQKSS